ncbi:hypothetical protein VOLCADRAFT_107868 [Volvox carteri f. nagariensis]|uniref:Uncharacterized protein n=1 Tax=Volvox carteri f. nagariensis TaxID=3068 RepID=D8UGY8_VOLCA|nr:uncharacterized protein VOLCADRAFT_107868 [Volvox carteri f. nagariensis]EFJ41034.1 hypothetical protein VOLCADRAFT_107868 [Volvox carteri f. nagariensis]|eukprot:XP_002957898.1 hypothetical protein VOLCADRAFT_107868 [Volvox carteri f. nagariensis]
MGEHASRVPMTGSLKAIQLLCTYDRQPSTHWKSLGPLNNEDDKFVFIVEGKDSPVLLAGGVVFGSLENTDKVSIFILHRVNNSKKTSMVLPSGTIKIGKELKKHTVVELPLQSLLGRFSKQQVRAAMDAIDMGPEASHRLVHIVPYDNFKEKRLTFASDWVAEEFTKRAWIDEQDQVKSLMEYSAEAVKGILFEKVMHGVLAMGGKFDVVPLHPETLERGEEEELDIQACTESLRFTDDEASDMMSSIKNMYLRPVSGNFPVIDALKVPEMHLFQMTISRSKVLNADELENVLKRLGIPAPGQEGCQPSLYFVVHPGVYNKFKELHGGQQAANDLRDPITCTKRHNKLDLEANMKYTSSQGTS